MFKMSGWIKLHRQLFDNDMWLAEKFTRGQAWVDLLLMANHEPRTISVRGNMITINRGEVGRGVRSLSERWQWSKDKVSRFLCELENAKMIGHRESKILGVISILNYDSYQTCDTDKDTDRTQTRTQIGRNKNVKNVKNEKNTTYVGAETNISDTTKNVFEVIDNICQAHGIENKVNLKALNVQVLRHESKVRFNVEIQKCVTWLIDNGKKDITTMRLANWFERSREIQKREEVRQLERNQAKNDPHLKQRIKESDADKSVSHFLAAQ